MLGLRRCTRFEMLVYVSPVGSYFSRDAKGLKLRVLDQGRVAPGGTGAAKAAGNYPSGIQARMHWQEKGYADVLYLDARQVCHVTETSGSNVFVRMKDDTLVTPPLDDQILPGITRASVIEIARADFGMKVEERDLPIDEVVENAAEIFCTGTAWTVRSVGEIVHGERTASFPDETARRKIFDVLRGFQSGAAEDEFGWTREVAAEVGAHGKD